MEKSKECEGKPKCLKEINPEVHPGIFWSEPWKYEETLHACFLCGLNLKDAEETEEQNES